MAHQYQFYIPPSKMEINTAILDGEEFIHCCNVLRMKSGRIIDAFDGTGGKYKVRLESISKNRAECKIVDKSYNGEILPRVIVGIGLVKNRAIDEIVKHITSLGISEIYFLKTTHSVKKGFNCEHLRKISINALKQCGGSRLPTIHEPITINDYCEKIKDADIKLIAEQKAASFRKTVPYVNLDKVYALLVGPEGGFSDEEYNESENAGFVPVSLTRRRLRTELATVSLLSALYIE